jgi:hypothetical protein
MADSSATVADGACDSSRRVVGVGGGPGSVCVEKLREQCQRVRGSHQRSRERGVASARARRPPALP